MQNPTFVKHSALGDFTTGLPSAQGTQPPLPLSDHEDKTTASVTASRLSPWEKCRQQPSTIPQEEEDGGWAHPHATPCEPQNEHLYTSDWLRWQQGSPGTSQRREVEKLFQLVSHYNVTVETTLSWELCLEQKCKSEKSSEKYLVICQKEKKHFLRGNPQGREMCVLSESVAMLIKLVQTSHWHYTSDLSENYSN